MKWSEMTEQEQNRLVHEKVMAGLPLQCPGQLVVDKKDETSMLPPYWWVTCDACKFQEAFYNEGKIPQRHESVQDIPDYSTDMNAAWQIMAHERFISPSIIRANKGTWLCSLWVGDVYGGLRYDISASTAQDAICLASLKACGVEIEL